MATEAEKDIARLKDFLGVSSEAELARALMIGQSTISSWKARGRVPDRMLRILRGDNTLALGSAPVTWSDAEKAALGLALVRFCRLHGAAVASGDFRAMLDIASRPDDLWSLFRAAQRDLVEEADQQNVPGHLTALSVILHDEAVNPEGATQRSKETVAHGRSRVALSNGTEVEL
jgi:hypothetical protein